MTYLLAQRSSCRRNEPDEARRVSTMKSAEIQSLHVTDRITEGQRQEFVERVSPPRTFIPLNQPLKPAAHPQLLKVVPGFWHSRTVLMNNLESQTIGNSRARPRVKV